ncbi:family 16 glycoside hydrolase [Gemmata sp.]|uniref:family 16 glycoside hydrolase n=1 Tax=Gemmata sp. TaxID=1914242 RepID=UPI003F6F3C48
MSWPMSQDFNEALQNPRLAFTDPDLKDGETVVGAHGLPLPRSGNFADVYQVRAADGREWAVKCFTRPVTGLGDRYAAITEALAEADFPFTVGFEFLAEGVRVGGVGRPVVKMEWVEGLLFNQVVRENAGRPNVLVALGQMWAKLCKRLREAGVAHADLQHGNVLLVAGSRPGAYGLKLIDYDGMYVPALANTPSGESGHPSYQHPARAKTGAYSRDVDRFPHLVVATALRGLAACGPALWEKYDNGDNLLFTEEDFQKPAGSKVMRELWETGDPAVQALVGRLAIACTRPIPQTPWLDQILPDADPAPLDDGTRRAAAAALGIPLPAPVAAPPIAPPHVAAPLFEVFDAASEPVPVARSKRPSAPVIEVDVELVEDAPWPGKSKPARRNNKSSKTVLLAGGVVLLLAGGAAAVVMSRGKPKTEVAQNKPDEPAPAAVKEKEPGKKQPPKAPVEPAKPKDPGEPAKPKDPVEPVQPKDPVPVAPLPGSFELLEEPYPRAEGSPAVGGWRRKGADYLMVISNASDRPVAIPDTKGVQLAARGVAVHPGPKESVAVVWKSPIAGKVRVAARVTHLDRGGGNGVAWWLEHRAADRAVTFADGVLDVGGDAQPAARVLQVEKGDTVVLGVDARDGNHNNDTTGVALSVADADKPGQVWDLGADVADRIAAGNPHADRLGNKDTWAFATRGVGSGAPRAKDPPPVPDEKSPAPPDAEAQARAEKVVKDVYKADYAKARLPADRAALAEKLLALALETRDDPAARFVLFREARDLAAEGGAVPAALDAIDAAAKFFDINPLAMKADALALAARTAPIPARKTAAETALSLSDDAVAADNYEVANRLAALAGATGRANNLGTLVQQAGMRSKEVAEVKAAYDATEGARAALKARPDDPDASAAVGKFLCLMKGDWDRGAPLLAAGSDAEFKRLAEQEVARPAAAADRVALGDGWWDLAAKAPGGRPRAQLQRRAGHWYREAVAELSGLAKTRVEKRVLELDKLGVATAFKGFTPLFSGKTLDGWQGYVDLRERATLSKKAYDDLLRARTKDAFEHWSASDGVLNYDGKDGGTHLQTTKDYGNFELTLDWKIERLGDSGVHVRGVPQVQIWDSDEHPAALGPDKGSGSGGLWSNGPGDKWKAPLKKADKPVGEWNTFQITVVGNEITVRLNGAVVVDRGRYLNSLDRTKPFPRRGPIELEVGAGQLWFRNIAIKELP